MNPSTFWSPGNLPRSSTSNVDAGDIKVALADFWDLLVTCAYTEVRNRAAQLVKKLLTSPYNLTKIFREGKYISISLFYSAQFDKPMPTLLPSFTVLLLVGQTCCSHEISPHLLHKGNENSAHGCMFWYYFITLLHI